MQGNLASPRGDLSSQVPLYQQNQQYFHFSSKNLYFNNFCKLITTHFMRLFQIFCWSHCHVGTEKSLSFQLQDLCLFNLAIKQKKQSTHSWLLDTVGFFLQPVMYLNFEFTSQISFTGQCDTVSPFLTAWFMYLGTHIYFFCKYNSWNFLAISKSV